jgi:hypothetical protein
MRAMNDELSISATAPAPAVVKRGWWQLPSVISLGVVVVVLSGAVAWSFLSMKPAGHGRDDTGLPWQVRADGTGAAEVFGLSLGRSTLADVQRRFPDDLNIGLIVPTDQTGQAPALEAYVESFKAGFVTGKLVLAFEADPAWAEQARARAPKNEVGEGGRSRRYTLAGDDVETARRSALVAMAYLPSARLDQATLVQRFGDNPERHTGPAGETQLLYAVKGVAIAVPPAQGEGAGGRVVIQYTAPRDFEARLRTPLLAASGAAR